MINDHFVRRAAVCTSTLRRVAEIVGQEPNLIEARFRSNVSLGSIKLS